MFTVRYPNGQAIQYNTANSLEYGVDGWHLYERKGGKWVASIQPSAGVIVEATAACRVYNGPMRNQLEELTKEVRSLKRKIGKMTLLTTLSSVMVWRENRTVDSCKRRRSDLVQNVSEALFLS